MFDGVDDERVAEPDGQRHQQHAQPEARVAETQRVERGGNEQQDEPPHRAVGPAQNGHEPVKDRIGQRPVDEMKQARVERLQPVHYRKCSGKPGVEN